MSSENRARLGYRNVYERVAGVQREVANAKSTGMAPNVSWLNVPDAQLLNGWTAAPGTGGGVAFRRTVDGSLQVAARLRATGDSGTVAFILPDTHRPPGPVAKTGPLKKLDGSFVIALWEFDPDTGEVTITYPAQVA